MAAGWNLDPGRWHDEMSRTIAAYGHDVSGRAGTEPTLAYHEQLAFLPDECDMNGGLVGEREAMGYAWEYFTRVYPNQEVYMCLHDEGDRYCVHALIGRTDLESGKRYDRGAPEALDLRRQVKDELDSKYGLEHVLNLKEKEQQMVYGPLSYSKVRERSREASAERFAAKQQRSYKRQLFRDCAKALRASTTLGQYAEQLEGMGYAVGRERGGLTYTVKNALGQERTFTDKAMRAAKLSTEDVSKAVRRNRDRELARWAEKRLQGKRGRESKIADGYERQRRQSEVQHHRQAQQSSRSMGRSR